MGLWDRLEKPRPLLSPSPACEAARSREVEEEVEEETDEKHSEPTCPWEAAFVTLDLLHCLVTRLFIFKQGAGWWTSQKEQQSRSQAPTPSCYLIHVRPAPWFLPLSETRPLFFFLSSLS